MTKDLLIQAILCTRPPGTKFKYFSTPITSGDRVLNVRNNIKWVERIRLIEAAPVLDPSAIMFPPSWCQASIMEFWYQLITDHVDELIMAPTWDTSAGARMEHAHAISKGIKVSYYDDKMDAIDF